MKHLKYFNSFSLNEGYYDDPDFQGKTMVSNFGGFKEDDNIIRKNDESKIVGKIHHIWKDDDGNAIFVCKISGGLQKLKADEISKV